jgi:signal transduction histidine kinase
MAASLLARRSDSELITKPVSRILSSADRMQRMIAQLLDLTRVRLGRGIPLALSEVDLVEICRHVIDELEPPFGREIVLESAGDPKGTWDGDRLSQLLSNLIANACQHGRAGTPVRVRIDGATGDGVRVEVTNQGVIPPEVLPVVFEPLNHLAGNLKRGSSGLGLGLYITEQVVLAHGGRIQVASDEAQGTRVVVHLPRVSALSSTTPARTPAR